MKGRRETNTMPQWAGSCWYYLRYIDPDNAETPWDLEKEKYWMPVDLYVGGAEHAVLHLLYALLFSLLFREVLHVCSRSQPPYCRFLREHRAVFHKDRMSYTSVPGT